MPSLADHSEHVMGSSHAMDPLCQIVTPVGMLGYGFDEDVVDAELAKLSSTSIPTAIILDSGSTDSGPSKLALGSMTSPRSSYKRDLRKLVTLVTKYDVPLLFSSAGGDGSNDHVDEMHSVIEEIMAECSHQDRSLKVLSVYAEVPKELVKQRLESDHVQGCGPSVPPLTLEDIDSAPHIVAQIGCEPFLNAMCQAPDFDVVIGGRAYDPSPYVAFAAFQTMKGAKQVSLEQLGEKVLGGFFHMGKIMECGGSCAKPKCKSTTAKIYRDGSFDVYPLNSLSQCTPQSVAAHTLYEKSRPDLLYGPGGCLDLTGSIYKQLSDQIGVRVSGGLFRQPVTKYTVKLEAAHVVGYRTIFMGSMKDPILTSQVDSFLDRVQGFVERQHADLTEQWKLGVHKFGSSSDAAGICGPIFVVGEALGATQEVANSVAAAARIACVHGPYPGQKATSGNFGMGLGGLLEIPTGPCAEFCVYHLMELENGEEYAREIAPRKCISNQHEDIMPRPLFSWKQSRVGTLPSELPTASTVPPRRLVPSNEDGKLAVALDTTQNGSRSDRAYATGATISTHQPANDYDGLTSVDSESFYTLANLAGVIRSKNAGPFELTFDVIFNSPLVYNLVKTSNLLSQEVISKLFGVEVRDIIYCGFFDQALAFKATIPRMRSRLKAASGGFMEDDVHGSQQYLPLMNLLIPDYLAQQIREIFKT